MAEDSNAPTDPSMSDRSTTEGRVNEGLVLPRAPSLAPADLMIVGAGVHSYRQLTVEACAAIRNARVVYYESHEPDTVAFVAALNSSVQSIDADEYVLAGFRPDMYRRIAQRVIEDAARQPGVVLLELGSAVITDAVTQLALYHAQRAGVSVQVLPGVSSVETVLADLGYDPTERGLQILQAQRMVAAAIPLNPACAALILQPGYYDTWFWVGNPISRPGRYAALAQHLSKYYSADAEMLLIQTPAGGQVHASQRLWLHLVDLSAVSSAITPLDTLFIPPAIDDGEANDAFLAAVTDWEHTISQLALDGSRTPAQRAERHWYERDLTGVPARVLQESDAIHARRSQRRPPSLPLIPRRRRRQPRNESDTSAQETEAGPGYGNSAPGPPTGAGENLIAKSRYLSSERRSRSK